VANAANGAGMVAFAPTLNYVAGTVGAKLQEWRSVLDYMTPAQVADITSNTGLIDCATACASAFASGHKFWRMPEGTYRWAAEVSRPVGVSVIGDGIGVTKINCVTANANGLTSASGSRNYEYVGGFTITGAGAGTNSSIGVLIGDTTHGTDFCTLENVEATNFGDANIRLVNWIRGTTNNLFAHGDPTGVLTAANYGLHLKGTYAFAGSNYDNRIGYVEAYNNVQDIVVENGGKNNFDKVYCYNQNYTGTSHHIHELNSSLNHWNKPHIEPLSLAAGGGAMWLIESASGNPYTYMLGPVISDFEYENGTLGTTVDVIQVGTTGGGLTVYGTRIENGHWMPVSAGKYHVNLLNESSTQIAWPSNRNNNFPFDRILRELSINNPNASTNNSYVGSPYEQSYGTWTPLIKAGGASLGTLTAAKADWVRSGKKVSVWLDATLSAKTGNTGAVTITGCEAISPNGGTTVFTPKSGGSVPVTCIVIGLATAYPAYAYFNPATSFISFYNTSVTTNLTDTSFANATNIILYFEFELA
jgi:hypothetical protein